MGYFDKIRKMLSSSTTLPPEAGEGASCCGDHTHADNTAHEHKHDGGGCCCGGGCACEEDDGNVGATGA